ncbi:aminoglycoside phosphotransferase family protein [Actinomadura xylanilytica]|uniref:aminoglycoside phosphotransferase family protein n=1 Tax=Actinomadura xylanilytica TaxID=887459 RepID=UPI00255AF911|nr:aminoglycoside phosphotransferase family protein [Actinomadura xylanilytica]MDL4773320.1 aminoglycoside phosphotransferase family protein [Actinomadura xylanilytica]
MTEVEVPEIPRRLVDAIIFLRGEEDGRAWLAELPGRIAEYAERWGLRAGAIAEGGAMSCCLLCATADGVEAVLKVPVDADSGRLEVLMLNRWAGTGATPAVLRDDAASGVFLMTRVRPGTTAWATGGASDSARFGELLTKLNSAVAPVELKDVGEVAEMRLDWARERFADPRHANDVASIEQAEVVLDALLRSTRERHVLHADLQAKNVLRGEGGRWFAIDPLGAVGDLNAEAALWVAIQDGPATIPQRLSELDGHAQLDAGRLAAWTFVLSIAEYRPYLPASAERMAAFLAEVDAEHVLSRI